MRKLSRALALLLVWVAGSATAQESTAALIERFLRMPSHRMLMRSLEEDATLEPFVTDGCSGGLSTAWQVVSGLFPGFADAHASPPLWEECCAAHDLVYHAAGGATSAAESYEARLAADEALRQCVVETGAERAGEVAAAYGVTEAQVNAAYLAIAEAMYDAVRLGGAPCSGMPWRWGYGYPDCHPAVQ